MSPYSHRRSSPQKGSSGVSASYVGELRKAKASKAKFGNVRLSSKKLM